jgi:hypothetical protein
MVLTGTLKDYEECYVLACNFIDFAKKVYKPVFTKDEYQSILVACFKALINLMERIKVRAWYKSHKKDHLHFYMYMYTAFEGLFICGAKAMRNNRNVSFFDAGKFGEMDLGPYHDMFSIVMDTWADVKKWMRMESPCEVFHVATPPELNLPALRIKQMEDQIALANAANSNNNRIATVPPSTALVPPTLHRPMPTPILPPGRRLSTLRKMTRNHPKRPGLAVAGALRLRRRTPLSSGLS